jgi:hypothetical protein
MGFQIEEETRDILQEIMDGQVDPVDPLVDEPIAVISPVVKFNGHHI